ncbi:MAG TPA: TonB-dependent receptor [Thermoanaerobaculia bacterium]|nr:TonB-dependent receptor [Thermoanaerobaculia bacterium]
MYQSIVGIVLLLQTAETITVTATRTKTRLADTPASVVVLDRNAVLDAATADDALRQVPGFALFRRTGSRTANPTSQGVSLRGVGASGASRALVLDDGIPVNDAFGGWVYWGRVPRAALDRVEVLRGGASDLYGSSAMGGVVQFVRRNDGIALDASAGSQRTGTFSLFAAHAFGDWRGSISADLLRTDGYVLVDRAQRGAVDVDANARHAAVDATLARTFGDSGRAFLRASHYNESRDNGTPLQINDTNFRQLALGADAGAFSLRAYGSNQDYHQTFSAVAADRNSERLTVDQRVPSRARGGSLQFAHALGERNVVLAGVEERSVAATDVENATRTKGAQRTTSAFVEDSLIAAPSLTVTGAVRFDRWNDENALHQTTSPRVSALWRLSDRVAVTAAAYRAFRAPTLNELLRNFRVGNVLTLANNALTAERLSAIEAGVRVGSFRATLFSMTTDDTISNVTLSTTPSLITRQRQNQGSSRSRGIELDADRRLGDFRLSAGWLFADAALSTGRRTPQVPRNAATLQATWRDTLGVQARWSSRQFDDDLNQFPLRGYTAVDLFAARGIVYAAVENVTNARIEAGATPVVTLGQPRALRVGVRWAGK